VIEDLGPEVPRRRAVLCLVLPLAVGEEVADRVLEVFARHPRKLAIHSLIAEQTVLSRKKRKASPIATSSAGRLPRSGTLSRPYPTASHAAGVSLAVRIWPWLKATSVFGFAGILGD
jgi:hypothetical protein